jgi:hypothetical protein
LGLTGASGMFSHNQSKASLLSLRIVCYTTVMPERKGFWDRFYSVGKACGGFHADFLLRSHREPEADCLVCLGCGEAIWIVGGEMSLFDLSDVAWKDLRRAFLAAPSE